MLDAKRQLKEPVELVRSDLRGLWLLLVPAIVVGPILALHGRGPTKAILFALVWGFIFSVAVIAIRRLFGGNAVLVDEKGLIVVTRGKAIRTHGWDRIRHLSWHAGSVWPSWDPGGLLVTTDDGPVRVGSVVILRPSRREEIGVRVEVYLASLLSRRRTRPPEPRAEVADKPSQTAAELERRDGPWWQGVLYHVYLRSFVDSDGDGVGDLPGLISRLDHLAWLGVDGVWVSPVMPSPNEDWGYDVADFCAVDPAYGTLEDVDTLVAEAAKRGMRVLFDLVPNHSSDRHPWFVASRSSRTDPKRDWYVWRDPQAYGAPPNNWVSNFFGPAWQLDERTGQHYLHSFLETQPDLNWWNPEVRAAFDEVLRFWFDRGVAGFRIDVCHKMVKDPELRDNPPATSADSFIERAWGQREQYSANHPENHQVIRRWRRVAEAYDEPRVLVGETYVLDLPRMATYYGRGDELNLAFNIPFLYSGFSATAIREVVEATLGALPEDAWPVWNGGSHDISRFPSRWCLGDERAIRAALMMLLTMRGTSLLYYGDEIGMADGPVGAEDSLDPLGRRAPVRSAGRDPARTPMQWSAGPGAGFTSAEATPWLPIGNAAWCNVSDQRSDPGSALNLCRDLIRVRRSIPDLNDGDMAFIDAPAGVLAWRRGARAVVAINLSVEPASVEGVRGETLVATRREREGERVDGSLKLGPWEGVVLYE